MRCLPSFIDGMGPAGGFAGAGDLGLVAVGFVASSFLASLGRGKKLFTKQILKRDSFFFFNQKKEVAPTTSNVGFSSPSLFVVVFFLLLLLTHIARFPCGGRGCSKRVGAVTVRQNTSALPHASRVLGWAMGQGSITPATHILGPRTLHPAPETCVFCYAKTGEKIFLWPSEHFCPVLSLSPHKYTPWSAHCALQEAQKPRGARSQALLQGAASPSCPSSQPSSCRLVKEILFWLEER